MKRRENITCYEAKKSSLSFVLQPLTELVICVTGLDIGERERISQLVQQNGGIYSPDLTKTCTHLIASSKEGTKYQYAMRWNIKIIKKQWIFECVDKKMCVEEEPFLWEPIEMAFSKDFF